MHRECRLGSVVVEYSQMHACACLKNLLDILPAAVCNSIQVASRVRNVTCYIPYGEGRKTVVEKLCNGPS